MDLEIHEVPAEDKVILRHLLQRYIYDFSEMTGADADGHGLYGYDCLDHCWIEPNRHPFLIRVDGRIAGFALVSVERHDDGDEASMSDFFILRKFRRSGVGEAAACKVFDLFPGRWL